jgi:hypothetical protein
MMPARGLGLRCKLLTLIAVGIVVPAGAKAQSSVTLRATVSEMIALSVAPNFTPDGVHVDALSSGSTLRITLSGAGAKSPVIRVPLLVRSNIGFRISGTVESTTAEIAGLLVTDVHPTGKLVASNIIPALNVERGPLDLSRPFLVATGPRVSLGGTLNSPNNALQITLLIRLQPRQDTWTVQLNLAGTKQL